MAIDQYQLGELLGRGGMGQVHAARHRSGQLVAIKRVRNTLLGDRVVVDRLSDEARLLRCVSHPNVVRAIDDGTSNDGLPFLVMDRAHGTPLNQLIAFYGALPRERMIAVAAQLFAGLSAIHDAKIIHADLKSHNILVDDVDIVTIIDFGLARTVTEAESSDGLVAGTPAYMAPELIAGSQPTIAADIYATATILYEMLTGSTPFSGHISTILARQLSEVPEPPSQRAPDRGITPAIDRAVMRGLDATPAHRYRSVPEFASAFVAALDDNFAREAVLARGSALLIDQLAAPLGGAARPGRAGACEQPTVRRTPGTLIQKSGEHMLIERAEAMISEVLSSAHQAIERHRLPIAIDRLEQALEALTPPAGSEEPICASAWRIETVLAALYESLGKQDHARRLALVGYRHALRTGCPLAEQRSRALVDRLVVRARRFARGSTAIALLNVQERGGGQGR